MKSPLKPSTDARSAAKAEEFSHCTKPSVPADIEDGLKSGPARIRKTLLTKPELNFSSTSSDATSNTSKLPDPIKKALKTGPYRIRKTSVVANYNHFLFGKKKLTSSNLKHFKENLTNNKATV